MKKVLTNVLMVIITIFLAVVEPMSVLIVIPALMIFSKNYRELFTNHKGLFIAGVINCVCRVYSTNEMNFLVLALWLLTFIYLSISTLIIIGSFIISLKDKLMNQSMIDLLKEKFANNKTQTNIKETSRLSSLLEQIITYPKRARDSYVNMPRNKADRTLKHYVEYYRIMTFCNLYLLREHSNNFMYETKKRIMKQQMHNVKNDKKTTKEPKQEKQPRKPFNTKNNMKKLVKPILVIAVIVIALLALTKCETKKQPINNNSLPKVEISNEEDDSMNNLNKLQDVENDLEATEKEQAMLEEKLQKLEDEKKALEEAKKELEEEVQAQEEDQNNYYYEDNTDYETPEVETPQIETPEVETPEVEEPEVPQVEADKTLPNVVFKGVNEAKVGQEIGITINTVDENLKSVDINKISIENANFEVEKISNEKVNVYVTFEKAGSYSFTVADAYAVDESNNTSIMTTMNITVVDAEVPEVEEPEVPEVEEPEVPETEEPEVADTTRPEVATTLPEVIKEFESFELNIQLSDDVKVEKVVVDSELLTLPEGMKLLDLSLITEDSLKAIIQVDEAVENSVITVKEGLVYDAAGNTNSANSIKVNVEKVEVPETEVPEVPETEEPEVPETEVPEVPETEVPETTDTTRPEVAVTIPEVIKEYEAFQLDIQLSDDIKIDNIVVNDELLILPEGMKLLDLSLITENSLTAIIQVDEAVENSMITIQEGLVFDAAGNTNLAKNINVEVKREAIEEETQEEISFQLSTANESVISGTTFVVRADVLTGNIKDITINAEDINVPEGVEILEVKKLDDHFDIIMTTAKDCAGTLEFSLKYSTNTVVIEITPVSVLPEVNY